MNPSDDTSYALERESMVSDQIQRRGVRDPAVLAAMRATSRHRFVPKRLISKAYEDTPLPIGESQTISQPYIVALMSELLRLPARNPARPIRVLEIGTGCGYQTAILARLADEVYSMEVLPGLARTTGNLLAGLEAVRIRCADGFQGWPEAAPFHGILVAAAPPEIPPPLLEQLAPGGRLVIPVGTDHQELMVVQRTPAGLKYESILPVRFVPMVGQALSR
ncbi:MAG: protein-L-isoaspartate(D-aspartate) O-methyltransferase [Leptospirales bacterium]|jgi:protein-L-isoaspartate(D-aspartate) O-methyltransferase